MMAQLSSVTIPERSQLSILPEKKFEGNIITLFLKININTLEMNKNKL
jgi:hypothetical protein